MKAYLLLLVLAMLPALAQPCDSASLTIHSSNPTQILLASRDCPITALEVQITAPSGSSITLGPAAAGKTLVVADTGNTRKAVLFSVNRELLASGAILQVAAPGDAHPHITLKAALASDEFGHGIPVALPPAPREAPRKKPAASCVPPSANPDGTLTVGDLQAMNVPGAKPCVTTEGVIAAPDHDTTVHKILSAPRVPEVRK